MRCFDAEEIADEILEEIWTEIQETINFIEDDVMSNYSTFSREEGPAYEECHSEISKAVSNFAIELATENYSSKYSKDEWEKICNEIRQYDGFYEKNSDFVRDMLLAR